MSRKLISKCLPIAALWLALGVFSVQAAENRTWTGTTGNWSDAANWGGTEPIAGDWAKIANGGTALITQEGEICSSIVLGEAQPGSVQMTGGSLKAIAEVIGNTADGYFSQSAGVHFFLVGDLYTTSAMYLGLSSGVRGTYELSGTGELNSVGEYIGYSGIGVFNHSAGKHVVEGGYYLWADTIDPSGTLALGFNSGSEGTYNLSGTGSLDAYAMTVGVSGKGTFNQSAGIASIDQLILGLNSGSDGTFNLTGGRLSTNGIRRVAGNGIINFGGGKIEPKDGDFGINVPMNLTGEFSDATININQYKCTIDSVVSGQGGLVKKGTGILQLNAANTYTGTTTIEAGQVVLGTSAELASKVIYLKKPVSNSSPSLLLHSLAGLHVKFDQTLKGVGTISGNVTIEGLHDIGDPNGTQTVTGNYSMLGELKIDLKGVDAGAGYDQLRLFRDVALSGSLLLDWTGMNGSTDASKLWILNDYSTTGTLSGEFSNYANGASLGLHDGREWQIWYGADSATGNLTGGNDVLIAPVPEPATIVLLALAASGLFGWMRKRRA
jgi:autotransporter-associated beta strand protein